MKTLSFLPAGVLLWMFAIHSYAQSTITVSGTYTSNQTWQADTVKVIGDVRIENSLTILPGTYVEFQGNYELRVYSLIAKGTQTDTIIFTINDTTGFSNFTNSSGGWGGITDYGTNSADSSVIRYCRFEYGKRISDPIPYFKGLLKFGDNMSKVQIDHCVFEHNYSKDGAIIKSDRNTELNHCRIIGNYSNGLSLRIGDAKNSTIRNNIGNGIELWNMECIIADDTIMGNTGYGLYIYQSKKASVRNNVISGNTLGVLLFQAKTVEFCGEIADRSVWDADTIKVTSDVTIGKQLIIRPGTYVEFQGHYELSADSIYAVGNIGDSITFTIQDTTGFSNRNIIDGGWKKISAANSAKFDYCRIMFGKNIESSSYPRLYKGILKLGGTANIKNSLLINNYSAGVLFEDSDLILSNCSLIANEFNYFYLKPIHCSSDISNCSFFGNSGTIENTTIKGSVFISNKNLKLYASEDENLFIDDCIFQNNQDLSFEPAGTSYSHFKLINTKIIDNDNLKIRFRNAGLIYLIGNIICNNTFKTSIEMSLCLNKENNLIINNTFSRNKVIDGSALINSYYSFFNFYNNILFANDISNSNGILFSAKDYNGNIIGGIIGDFRNNLIEGGLNAFEYIGPSGIYEDNKDEDPQFVNAAGFDFHLTTNSPCINTGTPDTTDLKLPATDLDGNPRIIGNSIDMGAYEFQGVPDYQKPMLEKTPDQIVKFDSCKIMKVAFYDYPDNTHLIDITTDNENISIIGLTGDTTNSTYRIAVPKNYFGVGNIYIKVENNHGHFDCDTFLITFANCFCGIIDKKTIWDYDTVKITCDITIADNAELQIKRGVIMFTGNYRINSYGKFSATGTPESPVIFTVSDTTGFSLVNSTRGGWKGFYFKNNYTSTFNHCVIQYGKNIDVTEYYSERGMLINYGSYLTIDNCTFNRNYSKYWAVIHSFTGESKITNSCFDNSYPTAIWVSDKAEISNCKISNAKNGGIVFNGNFPNNISILINNCEIENNIGFGIYIGFGYSPEVSITNNRIKANGMGLIIFQGYQVCNGVVDKNVILNNDSTGIYLNGCNLKITNNLIAKNGGGVILETDNSNLINNTIVNNTANYGGGILNFYSRSLISNCIIWGNRLKNGTKNQIYSANCCPVFVGVSCINLINNLIEGGREGIICNKLYGKFENIIDEDPRFADTTSFDFHLNAGSPCINSGTPDTIGLNLPGLDLDGNPRLLDFNVDLGAYEYGSGHFKLLAQPNDTRVCQGNYPFSLYTYAFGGVNGYQWQKGGMNIPGKTDSYLLLDLPDVSDIGNYNCIITALDTVVSTDTVQVLVDLPVSISGQSDSFAACERTDTLIALYTEGGDAMQYSWLKNGFDLQNKNESVLEFPSLHISDEGKYIGVAENACGSDSTKEIQIKVFLLPQPNLGEDTILHTNDALTLNAGEGFDSYQWNTGAGTQVLPVNTSHTGDYEYWVRVSDSNSCAATDTILVTVELPDAIQGYTKVFGLKVYPNPTAGIVYLVPQTDIDGETMITVIDAGGRLIHKDKLSSLQTGTGFSIDLSGLGNGIYLMMIDHYPVRIIKSDCTK